MSRKLKSYFNNKITSRQDVWNNPGSCNDIKGTDGSQFKPSITEYDVIYAYEPLVCRWGKLIHDSKVMPSVDHRGIDSIRFFASDDNFARSEQNRCYCVEDSYDDCPANLINMKRCGFAKGVMDMLISAPYFQPFPEILNSTSIKPPLPLNYLNYGTYLDVEPV